MSPLPVPTSTKGEVDFRRCFRMKYHAPSAKHMPITLSMTPTAIPALAPLESPVLLLLADVLEDVLAEVDDEVDEVLEYEGLDELELVVSAKLEDEELVEL
jgi:hypothetical protein